MPSSPFYVPVSLGHTALLLSDVQTQVLNRFPPETQEAYLSKIQTLLDFFRRWQSPDRRPPLDGLYDGVPMIIHHALPLGKNQNAFVSPYNKLARWVATLHRHSSTDEADLLGIPPTLCEVKGWGKSGYEIVLEKLQTSCFGSSELLSYLRARDIKHVVLVGLTTVGSILSTARHGADLDFHIICVKDAIMDDEPDLHDILMDRVLSRYVDVVQVDDILALGR